MDKTNVGLEIIGALILGLILRNFIDIPLLLLVPILFLPIHWLNNLNKKFQEKSAKL